MAVHRGRGLGVAGGFVAAILELSRPLQESPAIPKRKPPSQRPERKLDETAQAIARDLEETKAAKAPEVGRPAPKKSKPEIGPVGKITARRKSVGPAVTPSTKRPKTARRRLIAGPIRATADGFRGRGRSGLPNLGHKSKMGPSGGPFGLPGSG